MVVRQRWLVWLWLSVGPLMVAYAVFAASQLAFPAAGLWVLSVGLYWTFAWFYVGLALAAAELVALVVRGLLAARRHLSV